MFRKVTSRAVALLALFGMGCQQPAPPSQNTPPAPNNATGYPKEITDSRGKKLTQKAAPKRIVSLTPSNTEILFALGQGDRIVGVTTACDYPPEALKKPKIGGFQIQTESVLAQNPDLIVAMAGLNDRAIQALEKLKAPVFVVSARTVAETYDAIRLIGDATNSKDNATKIAQTMRERIEKVGKERVSLKKTPTVLMLYGVKPAIYTTGPGSYLDEIIRLAGGKNALDKPAAGDRLQPEQVVLLRPDVILGGKEVAEQAKQMPGWATGVPAIRENRIYSPPSDTVLVRPGPRLPDAVEDLAKYLRSVATRP